MEQQEFWQKIESFLRNYDEVYSQARWFGNWGGLTRGREGYFVFLRFVFLAGLYVAAFYLPLSVWSKILLTIIAGYLIVDMFMLPTSIAFSGIPIRPLRSLVLVFFIYLSICIAFGLLYITLCRSSFNIHPDLIDLLYFSGTTLSTLGLGDIIPAEAYRAGQVSANFRSLDRDLLLGRVGGDDHLSSNNGCQEGNEFAKIT